MAYFLLDDHPLSKIGYTPSLSTIRSEIILKGQFPTWLFKGMINQRMVEIVSMEVGARENIFQFTLEFNSYCLAKSLIASLKG